MTDETSGQDFADINEALAGFAGETGPEGGSEAGVEDGDLGDPELDQEEMDAIADAQRAMAEARERLADVPAEIVITNHVMGLYELAAIHLSAPQPDLRQAALSIDALACLVDGLGDRLGADAGAIRDALVNIRMAFVQIKGSLDSSRDPSAN